MNDLKLLTTLWPTFPHFTDFADDDRLAGVRLNSAMMEAANLEKELEVANRWASVPMYFDIKGRQLRVRQALNNMSHRRLELILNHPIEVPTPTMVLFKAGADHALLEHVVDGGKHLIFKGGPQYLVKPGESICIRHPDLKMLGPTFLDYEIEKIDMVKKAGINRWFLSYVESQQDVDEFRDLIGADAELGLKIETKRGLEYVANKFQPDDNTFLVLARGDLFVEVDKPHDILAACRLIIEKDPEALAGSRILLSVVKHPVPECHDFSDLAWLYDIGYRKMMLCDELCLDGALLSRAINAFDCFRKTYAN